MKTRLKVLETPMILGMMLVSCTDYDTGEKEVIKVSTSELSLDSMETAFLETLNEIDHNLALIRQKEGVIVLGPNSNIENNLSQKERILRDIQMINSLMEENRKKIEDLTAMLDKSNMDNKQLRQLASSRNAKFLDQRDRIEVLKEELSDARFQYTELNKKMSEMELRQQVLNQMVEQLNEEVNTAYYALGTFRELKDHGVVEKEGGILGLGKTKSLYHDFNEEYFTKIDISKVNDIPIFGKKANILTQHPSTSYEFIEEENQITAIHIKDPESFWKANKYLVVEVKL